MEMVKTNMLGVKDPGRRGQRSSRVRQRKTESQPNRDTGSKRASLRVRHKTAGVYCGQSTALIRVSDFLRLS